MPVLTTLPVQLWTTCAASLRHRPLFQTFTNCFARTLTARHRRPTGRTQPDPLRGTTSDQHSLQIYTPYVTIYSNSEPTFVTTGSFFSIYRIGSPTVL